MKKVVFVLACFLLTSCYDKDISIDYGEYPSTEGYKKQYRVSISVDYEGWDSDPNICFKSSLASKENIDSVVCCLNEYADSIINLHKYLKKISCD